jgi:hypothetical protein
LRSALYLERTVPEMKNPINRAAHPQPAAEQITPSTKAATAPSDDRDRRLTASITIPAAIADPARSRTAGETEKIELSRSPSRRLQ